MTKKQIETVLKEIFDPFVLGDEVPMHKLNKGPSFIEIEQLAKLIVIDKSEESFQVFLQENPHFLFRLAPSTDDTNIGFLSKPPISNFNVADFVIFSFSQGGARMFLIEIERPNDKLFTKKLTPAAKLQTALGQIHDWDEWIKNNKQTFLNTSLRILKETPQYPKKTKNGSFTYWTKHQIEALWQGFGGNDYCTFQYLVIIGRWSKLSEKEKKRLMYLNQTYENQNIRIRTYDNFIRRAIEGPKYFW